MTRRVPQTTAWRQSRSRRRSLRSKCRPLARKRKRSQTAVARSILSKMVKRNLKKVRKVVRKNSAIKGKRERKEGFFNQPRSSQLVPKVRKEPRERRSRSEVEKERDVFSGRTVARKVESR